MADDLEIKKQLLVDGDPGNPGDVLVSQGRGKLPTWKSVAVGDGDLEDTGPGDQAKTKKQNPALVRLVDATVRETTERTIGTIKQAFPLLDPKRYQQAVMSLPGMEFASTVAKKAGLFETKEDKEKKERESTTKQTFTVLESILSEVVKIREGMEKFKRGGRDLDSLTDVERAQQLRQLNPEMSPQEALMKGRRGGGYGKLDKRTKEIQAKAKDAEAVKKPATVPKKLGIVARAGQAVAGAGRAVVGGVARAGAAVAGAAGPALPWLAAFAAVLPFFLPDDIKGVIGAIFRGLLEGIGLDKDTIDAIFVPFQILSDVAEVIKKVLGLLWDGIKSIVAGIGNIINWFGDRKSKNAAEEVSKATGGTGHGEFTTGAETTTEVPQVSTEAPKGGGGTFSGGGASGSWDKSPAPAAAPVATPQPVPTAAPAAPPPVMVTPPTLDKEVEEFFNKPENAGEKLRLDQINTQISTFKNAIASTNQALTNETDPEKKKNYEFVLKRQLEPGLKNAEKARDMLIDNAKKSATPVAAAPAAAPPPPTPAGGATPEASGAAGGSAGGGGGGGGGGELAGGGEQSSGGAPSPAAAPVPSAPTTGEEIGEASKQIEAERSAGTGAESSTNIIDKGEIAAGTQEESAFRVPSPVAPRQELDLDIFFTAVA